MFSISSEVDQGKKTLTPSKNEFEVTFTLRSGPRGCRNPMEVSYLILFNLDPNFGIGYKENPRDDDDFEFIHNRPEGHFCFENYRENADCKIPFELILPELRKILPQLKSSFDLQRWMDQLNDPRLIFRSLVDEDSDEEEPDEDSDEEEPDEDFESD